MNIVKIRLTHSQHTALKAHLFPGDGKEALAVCLCGRSHGLDTDVLLVHKIDLVSHNHCTRQRDRIDWKPTDVESLFREAADKGLALLKVHSHPGGHKDFSPTDDDSDRKFFASVFGWVDGGHPHASAIMLPDGRLHARAVYPSGNFGTVSSIAVIGDDVTLWPDSQASEAPEFTARHAQAFGEGTTRQLASLRIAVVGCSGTGSPVVEQLARLGVGELVLVDPDRIEECNLNRILGATMEDARAKRLKVDVLRRHVQSMGLGTRVHVFPTPVEEASTIRAIASCDFVVGCMDSLSGRHVLSRLARYYTLPYVDVGVKLEARPDGTINQVAGAVHYLQPESGDFIDRGVFSSEALEAEQLWRANPDEYRERHARGYVRGVQVDRPAVISVNMCFASLAVCELLARIHPFRLEPSSDYATTTLSLSHTLIATSPDAPSSTRAREAIGRGDASPLLGMPDIGS